MLLLLSSFLCLCVLSHPVLSSPVFGTLWTVAHQAPVSMGLGKSTGVGYHFLEFPASPASPALQADSLPMTHQGSFLCLVIFE